MQHTATPGRMSPDQTSALSALNPQWFPARVVAGNAGQYRVAALNGCSRGLFPYAEIHPLAGDWVAAERINDEECVIRSILPRHGVLTRRAAGGKGLQVLAVNVDTVCAVVSAGTDFNERRIERIHALAAGAGAGCAVIITKTDLAADVDALTARARVAAPGAVILPVCSVTGEGLAGLDALVDHGETIVLLGASGAGKSTLVARLTGAAAETGVVSAVTGKGKHTTSARELFAFGAGAILDTPGLKEIGLDGASDIAAVFPEIEALAGDCRFRDCSHDAEPGCAVTAAAAAGALDAARLASYRALAAEEAFQRLREERGSAGAERARWKQISTLQKEFKKR